MLSKFIYDNQSNILEEYKTFSQDAYSVTPADRPFGINKRDFISLNQEMMNINLSESKIESKLNIGVLDIWQNLPIFSSIIKNIKKLAPNSVIRTYATSDYRKMIVESDIWLAMLGISPADPLSHLSFMVSTFPNFKTIVTDDELSEISIIRNAETFSKKFMK
jgi:hypothetical protein